MDACKEVSTELDKAVVINGKYKCDFCGWADNDLLKYGPKYRLGSIRAHYYCVLLSKNLKQNGEDDEGMLGFLLEDIKKELTRCAKIKCAYCGNGTASIICKKKNCKNNFHLPCGLKVGSLHQFKGYYNSYCHSHRIFQSIPKEILKDAQINKVVCCICYNEVPLWNKMNYIWAPCCQKTWYHKKCLQKLALSAGYFFRCATCNNSTKFVNCVLKLGVFIPQQDASWELVPNAFSELLFKYDQCDAEICKCPNGRKTDTEKSIWELILCMSCGSQGIHFGCRNGKFDSLDWECSDCQEVTKNLNSRKPVKSNDGTTPHNHFKSFLQPEVFTKKRCRTTEDMENFILDKRKKCKSETEEDDVEIDVVTVEKSTKSEVLDTIKQSKELAELQNMNIDLEEVLASVKPGPLSFKLKVIKKYAQLLGSFKKPKPDLKDFNHETKNSVTKKYEDEGKQLYSPADFNIGLWNDERDNFFDIVNLYQPEHKITEEIDIIKIIDPYCPMSFVEDFFGVNGKKEKTL